MREGGEEREREREREREKEKERERESFSGFQPPTPFLFLYFAALPGALSSKTATAPSAGVHRTENLLSASPSLSLQAPGTVSGPTSRAAKRASTPASAAGGARRTRARGERRRQELAESSSEPKPLWGGSGGSDLACC